MTVYLVHPGDTVFRIAKTFGLTPEEIIRNNQLLSPDRLVPGQTLVLPVEILDYRVRRGDSIDSIAKRFSLRPADILAENPTLGSGNRIYPGQVIRLSFSMPRLGTAAVNGYVTDIGAETLETALPYLTWLSPFSFRADVNGALTPTFTVPVGESAAFRTENLLTVTNLRAAGGFDRDAAHSILTNAGAQDSFFTSVETLLDSGQWQGVDLDFEYIYPFDRDSYSGFLRRFAARLHAMGYPLLVAVAPKTSAAQSGLLYTAHDYAAIGDAADHVILMTYEWGYTYGPPMAVSPLDKVRAVLDYAVSAIPAEKLLMGIPNYGYDWTLPFRQGTAARPLTNPAAVQLAGEKGAEIRFDPRAEAPFYNYTDTDGVRHEVWFQDARSLGAMYRLAGQYGLGGFSFWNLNRPYLPAFRVLEALYDVEKLR